MQSWYREIAEISVLVAMTIPHVAYLGAVVAIKVMCPSWVAWIATESMAPFLLKWLYPVAATVVILHHARGFQTAGDDGARFEMDSDDDDMKKEKSPIKSTKSKQKKATSVKKDTKSKSQPLSLKDKAAAHAKKKKNKRRRSSLGALLRGTAPGEVGDNDQVTYTKEELHEDINYWLHFWLLRACLLVVHTILSYFFVIGKMVTSSRVNSVMCQMDLLFYVWIFMLPECLLILYPSAADQEKRDWSRAKQFCYECALNPVLSIPKVFKPIIISMFEKVSQVVPASWWKKVVTDQVGTLSSGLVLLKVLTETRRDTLVEFVSHVRTLLVPGALLFMPGFFTQYGVCYVQYVIPSAFSFRALHRAHRHEQRVLYLKFWVLNALAGVIFSAAKRMFGWFPFFTHFTFCIWVWLVLPRVITGFYNEFDRELQAFGLLPPVATDLSIDNTHTLRALTYIASVIPSASDVDVGKSGAEGDGKNGKDATPTVDFSKEDVAADDVADAPEETDKKQKIAMCDKKTSDATALIETKSSVGDNNGKEVAEKDTRVSSTTRRSSRRQPT